VLDQPDRCTIISARLRANTGRELQCGVFAQLILDKITVRVYAFNPDVGSRYFIVSAVRGSNAFGFLLAACAVAGGCSAARAQSIEPRAYPNAILRRQLALLNERGVKPRRVDADAWIRSLGSRGYAIGALA
jgi:hypothetical protein